MKKFFFFLTLFLLTNSSYTQELNQENYDIYSLVLNNRLNPLLSEGLDKIILLEPYDTLLNDFKNSYKQFLQDSSVSSIPMFFGISLRPSGFMDDFHNEKQLQTSLLQFSNDISIEPIIDIDRLNIPSISIDLMSSHKFYSLFKTRRGHYKYRKIDSSWRKLERKFKTNFVVELSKILINNNIAVVYYSQRCGGLCGSGQIVFLKKENYHWKELGFWNIWNN